VRLSHDNPTRAADFRPVGIFPVCEELVSFALFAVVLYDSDKASLCTDGIMCGVKVAASACQRVIPLLGNQVKGKMAVDFLCPCNISCFHLHRNCNFFPI
jgi:hypothetical protein